MHRPPVFPRTGALFIRSLALWACVGLAACLGSCGKEGGSTSPDPKAKTDPPPGKLVKAFLHGRITDEGGNPLAGVKVAAGAASTFTDAFGLFRLDGAEVPETRAVILATKAGYYDGARAEAPASGKRTRFELRMMKKEFTHSVPAAEGGKVEVADGAEVAFAGGSFLTASGAEYSGTVKVAARYLDPDSASFYDFFSGDNQGWGADGEFASLISVGVLRVDIQDGSGGTLKLAEDRPATLTFPRATTVEGPERIPLWHFDAAIGQWREEGFATLRDGAYVGEVAHFSDWNLDYKGSRSWDYCVRVTCGGKPVSGVRVRTFQKVALTDSAGGLCFVNVPADRPNSVEILASDNGGRTYMDNPTALTVVEDADERPSFTLELDSDCPATVQGLVTGCGGEPAEAMVTAKGRSGIHYTSTEKGRFHLALPADSGWVLHASDTAGRALVPPLALSSLASSENREVGTLKICSTGTSDFTDLPLGKDESVHGSGGLPGRGAYPGWGLSPDGSLLAYMTEDGSLTLREAKTGAVRSRLENPLQEPEYIHVSFSRDNARMLIHAGDSLLVWDLAANPARRLSMIRPAVVAEFTGDGKRLFVASRVAATPVLIYEAETGAVLDTLHPTDFSIAGDIDMPRVKLLPDDDAFAYMVGNTGTCRVWSLSGDTLVRQIATGVTVNTSTSYEVVFSPSGRTFTVSRDRFVVSIFDVRSGDLLRRLDVRDLEGIANGVSGENGLPSGAVSDELWFRQAKVAADEVIQVFDYRDSAMVAVLPTPKVTSQVSWFMKLGHEGESLATRVWHPTAVPREFLDGFRIYHLD